MVFVLMSKMRVNEKNEPQTFPTLKTTMADLYWMLL